MSKTSLPAAAASLDSKTCGGLKWRYVELDDPDEPGELWRDVGRRLGFLRPETDGDVSGTED